LDFIKRTRQKAVGGRQGISVIEILVVISIIVIALTSLLGLVSFSLGTSTLIKQTTKANFLSQETMEAVRNFRDGTIWDIDGLGALTTMTSYHPEKTTDNPPKWQMVLGDETIDGFTRKIIFHDGERDGSGNIMIGGGVADLDTKRVTVVVSWQEKGRDHQVQLENYFTNWRQ
jgi:type II secretory pathway pseudopilin PulG